MALSVALPLSGLETESFSTFNSFGLIDILSLSQSSPSPSASSESSGIGSLGSLKSESINSESLPSSPQTEVKKPFDDENQLTKSNYEEVKIMYGGRNILNLMATMQDSKWNYSPAFLPQGNAALFFANRSQYHRLGPYGLQTEYDMDKCKLCGFQYVVIPNSVN